MPQSFEGGSNEVRRRGRPRSAESEDNLPADASPFGHGREAAVWMLQHQAGNRAVSAMLQRRSVGSRTSADVDDDQDRVSDRAADAAACFIAMPPQLQDGAEGPAVGEAAPEGAEVSVVSVARSAEPSSASSAASVPAAHGLMGPTPVSWGAINSVEDEGARAIPGPSVTSLTALQAAAGGNTGAAGWTSFPLATAKAPQFDMGSTSSTPGGMGPPSWSVSPTWKQHFYEGDSVCMFLGPGRHLTAQTEGGKPVFWQFSAAISARDGEAEAEHANDIKRARDISIKEAETVLNDHVIGKSFPAAGTQAGAEQKVLDVITSKLTHAGLGNDQTKWAGIYETLYRKSLERDNKGWHTFAPGTRSTNKAGEVTYAIANGTTSINTTTSNALIVY